MFCSFALLVITLGTFAKVTNGFYHVEAPRVNACTSVVNSACASCDTTSNSYQCKPAALPTGFQYGNCSPQPTGTCSTDSIPNIDCGNADWTSDTPSVSTSGTNCSGDEPHACKS